ncbi:hypothetical protein CGRA01v4_10610 [Colletotrichum graminicola]|uniref:Uncharacterized protein n=1 Tax=Colletotrichum graminicola (strain M1.001 / M2 / FGSC 10212) TaxID=645133 RepID=E3QKC0_COLGM|nr:uncharacterized protein GLRG_06452 [Colletotrichum graminicola M1.001]EFQ31308.1 hypothetical protein GLRG_06452 [Colletotrichum graminicola M1.001]WDK19323.1 hypothetical protein CGRA01v4_10610 [Colletotrichum graminicola]
MSSYAPTMQSQDDLAALFSRNLTFNPEVQSQVQSPKPEDELKQTPDPAPTNAAPTPAPIIYSITQHYTHSAHIARQPQSQHVPIQRPSSEPPQTEQLTPEIVLSQHGVDPSVLSPSQIQLFRISEEPHQLRLIEIWRAAPPTSSTENPSLAWTSTTLEQEEQLAKLRYERLEAEKQQQQNAVMSLDGTPVQSDDSRWLANSISHQVEPYMMSGYEEMMRREYEREQVEARPSGNYSHCGSVLGGYKPATDPVYKGFGDDWAREQALQMQMQMENQYGAFQHYGGQAGNMEAMEIL